MDVSPGPIDLSLSAYAAGHSFSVLVLLGTPWQKYQFLQVSVALSVQTVIGQSVTIAVALQHDLHAAEEDLKKSTITPHEDKAMASTA